LRVPPRSTPFPYTTLFRSPKRTSRPGFALHRSTATDLGDGSEAGAVQLRAQLRVAGFHEVLAVREDEDGDGRAAGERLRLVRTVDRKSTRLNSSHVKISYA